MVAIVLRSFVIVNLESSYFPNSVQFGKVSHFCNNCCHNQKSRQFQDRMYDNAKTQMQILSFLIWENNKKKN